MTLVAKSQYKDTSKKRKKADWKTLGRQSPRRLRRAFLITCTAFALDTMNVDSFIIDNSQMAGTTRR